MSEAAMMGSQDMEDQHASRASCFNQSSAASTWGMRKTSRRPSDVCNTAAPAGHVIEMLDTRNSRQ
eukprot:6194379-Prymnesium_polylepis.1